MSEKQQVERGGGGLVLDLLRPASVTRAQAIVHPMLFSCLLAILRVIVFCIPRFLSPPRNVRAAVSRAPPGFSYATRDGGKDSASFYGEAPKGGGSIFRDVAGAVKGAVKDTLSEVEGMFEVMCPDHDPRSFGVFFFLLFFWSNGVRFQACFFYSRSWLRFQERGGASHADPLTSPCFS